MTKAKDLWIPCDWETRKPLLMDNFFYIPQHYAEHEKSGFSFFSHTKVFNNDNPVHVEYCSGNGSWIIEKAENNPNINWVAVEARFDRARKIWVKMKNRDLSNLLVVFGKAEELNQYYLEDNAVSCSYINFPDPWPKKKHAKHRIFQKEFIESIHAKTENGGKMIWVTDDPDAALQMIENTLLTKVWKPSSPSPYYIESWPEYGSSYFEALWKEKGKKIRYMKFEK